MIWFTSDTHFNHRNVIKLCNRPFESVEEMDEALIKNWNSCVKENDEIYHLGDFAWQPSPTYLKTLISRLNGRKHLILGNHDKQKLYEHLNMFESIKLYDKISIDGYRVILFHYPIADYECMYNKSIHLYGHVHNNRSLMDNLDTSKYYAYNVCYDANGLKPVSFNQIKEHFKLNTFNQSDDLIY